MTAQPAILQGALNTAGFDEISLREMLGRGGMGSVFSAEHHDHGPCAVKFLDPKLSNTFHLTRFKREFRAAKRMQHANVVRVFEMGKTPAGWFFTMEQLAKGSILSHFPEQGSSQQIVHVGSQILAALDHIHAHSVVHRDIKPSNILLTHSHSTKDATCKITDMGIAKIADFTEAGPLLKLLGTARYVPPEYIQSGHIDPRFDLYATGVVLYEMAAGRHPLDDGSHLAEPDWLSLHLEYQPDDLGVLKPDLHPQVVDVIHRLLSKNPDERYRTAAEALLALRRDTPALQPDEPLRGSAYLAFPRFAGRKREVGACHRLLDGAFHREESAAAPSATFVSGPSGCGKSRLVERVLRDATLRYGVRLLTGQCSESGGIFSGAQTIIGDLQRGPAPGDAIDEDLDLEPTVNLDGAPEPPSAPTSRGTDSMDNSIGVQVRELAQDGLQESSTEALLDAACSQRTVVVVEDLQWADAPTLEMVAYWIRSAAAEARRDPNLRLAFILTHRSTHHAPHLSELRAQLQDEGIAADLQLHSMTRAAVYELVGARLMMQPDASALRAFCDHYFPETAASPLYINQGLELLLARGAKASALNATAAPPWRSVGAHAGRNAFPESWRCTTRSAVTTLARSSTGPSRETARLKRMPMSMRPTCTLGPSSRPPPLTFASPATPYDAMETHA